MDFDRHWLLTWTTYGSWLPGDKRGFVSPVPDRPGPSVVHNKPGTKLDANMPSLRRSSEKLLKGEPIRLRPAQAKALVNQFQETANYRGWHIFAVAVMATHCHLVVGVIGDPEPSKMLGDFKSYGSRTLNRRWSKPKSGTWWTDSGSKRKLPNDKAVLAAVKYVVHQEYPLAIWTSAVPELELAEGFHPGERGP